MVLKKITDDAQARSRLAGLITDHMLVVGVEGAGELGDDLTGEVFEAVEIEETVSKVGGKPMTHVRLIAATGWQIKK